MIFYVAVIWIMGIFTGILFAVNVLADHQKNQPNTAAESALACPAAETAVDAGRGIAPDRYGEGIRDD